jgi:hypothetical protein
LDEGSIHYAATALVRVAPATAFAYLADGVRMGDWTLGSWNRRALGEDLFVGTSLFDGGETYVRVAPDEPRLTVDYHVGRSPDALRGNVSVRVLPGPRTGREEGCCLVTLMIWRLPAQPEAEWRRICRSYDVEVEMIKGRLELGF